MNEEELKEAIEKLKVKNRTGIYTERIRVKQGQLKTLQERNAEVKQVIENRIYELKKSQEIFERLHKEENPIITSKLTEVEQLLQKLGLEENK